MNVVTAFPKVNTNTKKHLPSLFRFLACVCLTSFPAIAIEKPSSKPNAFSIPSAWFHKTWVIPADHRFFHQSIYLRFYFRQYELRARQIQSSVSNQNTMAKQFSIKKPQLTNRIWNLYQKNKEYVYGRIRTDLQAKVYRCKLWHRKGKLWLRIYTQPIYTTYELKPVHAVLE